MIDPVRLRRAYLAARAALLDERTSEGHWVGELSSSALSTATAVSALSVAARHAPADVRARYEQLIEAGMKWIFDRQNPDGGWGDTDLSLSNISTTMLVKAAMVLAGRQELQAEALKRAEGYIETKGGIPGLRRRYGKDKTFAVPILTNYALAGLVSWSEVSPLPFEAACLPQSWYRFARLPVVSYAIPALVAIGQARYFHLKPNPLYRWVRVLAVEPSLKVLQKMQPASGGFLEATPLTSFVVMSLAAIGRHDHPVTQLGLKFIVESARADGSWPIDSNLATWVTTLSINALTNQQVGNIAKGKNFKTAELRKWVIECQHSQRHPFTGADPGGWGWTDLSGAVPDADDTPGALIALEKWFWDQKKKKMRFSPAQVEDSAVVAMDQGVRWLLSLQNRDGGWPTFCRGWGALPFDRSGTDLTAHALRAIWAIHISAMQLTHYRKNKSWYEGQERKCEAAYIPVDLSLSEKVAEIDRLREKLLTHPHVRRFGARINKSMLRGMEYLRQSQRPDGSWLPLWFGNQHRPDDENPLYGTAKVLLAYRDLDRMNDDVPRRAVDYLLTQQNADGGWGGSGLGKSKIDNPISDAETAANVSATVPLTPHPSPLTPPSSSVEETAVVVEALLAAYVRPEVRAAVDQGLSWLVEQVENGGFRRPSPIGFYFAKLWYYERLYPIIFTVGALRVAVEILDALESPDR